jgi:hypothetical protein
VGIGYKTLISCALLIWLVAGCAKSGRQRCECWSLDVRSLVAKSAKPVDDSANLQKPCNSAISGGLA